MGTYPAIKMSNNCVEATNGNDNEMAEAPSSRHSLFDRVKAANDELTRRLDFVQKFLIILFGTGGCTICISILVAVLTAMIVMGANYLYACTRMIPIYLIVTGTVGIVKIMSHCRRRTEDDDPEVAEQRNAEINPYYDLTLTIFLFAWFIAGNVWIYGIPNVKHYCHPPLYYFAFSVTTATNIFIGLACCYVCFPCGLAACCNTTRESKDVSVLTYLGTNNKTPSCDGQDS